MKRAARTALELANRNLADGRVAEGLAYLVYAARKDPVNPALAPRIASVLTSYHFAIPRAAPLACGSRVLAFRFAGDGRSFFAGTEDGTFRVIDSESGAVLRQFRVGSEVVPGGWEFADRNDNVVGARFPDNRFALYDIATGAAKIPPLQLPTNEGIPDSDRVVGLSPSGRWIYANARQKFWLWNAETGAPQLDASFTEVLGGCDFSPAEDVLALTVGDWVEQWSIPARASVGPNIRFRDVSNITRAYGYQVRFSPDGKRLAIVDNAAGQVFDAATGALLHRLPDLGSDLLPAFTTFATNDRVFVRSLTRGGWWNLADGGFSGPSLANAVCVSLDAAGQRGAAVSLDGYLRIFDVGGTTPIAETVWRQRTIYCAAISPDGTQALMGTSDGMLFRFRLGRAAARPLVLPRPPEPAGPALFLPESPARLLVLAGDNAKMFEVASGREIAGGFRFPEAVLDFGKFSETHPAIRPDLKFMVVRTERGWQSWELGPEGVGAGGSRCKGPSTSGSSSRSAR